MLLELWKRHTLHGFGIHVTPIRRAKSCSRAATTARTPSFRTICSHGSALGFRMERQPGQGLGKVVEEMAVRKPDGHGVGKTEESLGKSVGKAEHESLGKSVGKAEHESFGKSVGKAEHESLGKSVGKAEHESLGKSVGKAEHESFGKSVGKAKNESLGKSVGKSENESVGKLRQNAETRGEAAAQGGDTGKAIGKVEGEESHIGKSRDHGGGDVHNQAMAKSAGPKEFVIAVAGKSDAEVSCVESLTGAAAELKLPEGATLVKATTSGDDAFRVDVFLDQLATRQFGRLVLHAPQLPSTHTLLSQNFKLLPVGTLSVADVQFQGKGRAGNSWESPKGCLMFSFTVQMSDGRAVPFLQYVVSLAIIEGIEDHCSRKGLQAPEVRIKWPNDLYADGLKVGGVLCTSTYSSKKFNIVIGVGLNVGNRQPTTCLDALLEGINKEAPSLAKDELLAAIINRFEHFFEVFCTQGFSALESNYYKRWLHSGQTVVLEERQEDSTEVSHIPMRIQGLTAAGYLRAIDDASETYELHPDGNSFDFLKGLVRQKM